MKLRQYIYPVLGMVLALSLSPARASTVVYEDFQLVSGTTIFTTPFDVSEAGAYRVELVDFEYPAVFDILSLGITQDLMPLGMRFGTGSFTFDVTTPGTLQAHLAAVPGSGEEGLYGLRIRAVPLPQAAMLFFSGLIGVVVVARRGSRRV